MLLVPDIDPTAKGLQRMPTKGVSPATAADMIQATVTGQDPQLRFQREDPNVAQPTFDAKRSRLNQALAVGGAAATLVNPSGMGGAIGSGLAAGAADSQNQIINTFLAQQDEATRISQAIRERNAKLQQKETEAEYEFGKERAMEELRQGGRTDLENLRTQNALQEIERRNDLSPEQKQKIRSEILENEAQADAASALAENRRNNVGGFRTAGDKNAPQNLSNEDLNQQMTLVDLEIRQALAEAQGTSDILPADQMKVQQKLVELSQRLSRLQQEKQARLSGLGAGRPPAQQAVTITDQDVQDAQAALQAGVLTQQEYEDILRQRGQ